MPRNDEDGASIVAKACSPAQSASWTPCRPPIPYAAASHVPCVAQLTANLGDTVTAVNFAEDDTMFAAGHAAFASSSAAPFVPARTSRAGANNRNVMLFSTDTGREIATLTAKAGVTSIAFLGSGEKTRVATGTFSGVVTIWHVGSKEEEHELTGL